MKQLTYKDIVVGKKYIIVKGRYGYEEGDIIIAVGEEGGAYHNDSDFFGFKREDSGSWNYLSYDCLEAYEPTELEKRELEVGQVFKVVGGDYYYTIDGTIVVLTNIETTRPRFTVIANSRGTETCQEFSLDLENVVRVYPPELEVVEVEEESTDVTIMCEGKETTISRESATKLNLI